MAWDPLKFIKPLWRHLLFLDVSPLIRLGNTKPLESVDMPPLPRRLDPRLVSTEFDAVSTSTPRAFLWGVVKVMRREQAAMAILITVTGACGLVGPLLIHDLIQTAGQLSEHPEAMRRGILLAIGLCLASLGEAMAFQHYIYWAVTGSQTITNGLNKRIYEHALALTRKSRLKTPIGDVVNYIGADTDAIAEINWVTVELTYCLVMIVAVTGLLFKFLGVAGLAAVAIMAILAPLTKHMAKRFTSLEDEIMKHRDRRVSQISQILSGIRIVKYFVWQTKMRQEIDAIRVDEVSARRRLALSKSISLMFHVSAIALLSVAAFGAHVALGRTLDAATVFACLGLFSMLEHPFGNLTNFISDFTAAKVSSARLVSYFGEETLNVDARPLSAPGRAFGVDMRGLTVRYGDAEGAVLNRIDLRIQPGECIAVVGPVGAGKSSLLLALLGEIPVDAGRVEMLGISDDEAPRTAFVPQEAFVQNGTLKDNISFGAVDAELALEIERAVRASALAPDLAQLPHGIETEIGEHGVNLSGGQKQRVCLARAVMAKPGLVLLDDPLSAVDERTEDHLVEELLFGVWEATTRVIVTHRLKHLARFDRVVFVENGQVAAAGYYRDLLTLSPRFAAFVAEHITVDHNEQAADLVTTAALPTPGDGGGRITEDEDREQGAVKFSVYVDYMRAMGGQHPVMRKGVIGLLIVSTILVVGLPIIQYSWLSVWTDHLAGETATRTPGAALLTKALGSDWQNIAVYGALGLAVLAAFFGQNLLWSLRAVAAGRYLHDTALKATLNAKIRFFDATPVGRILNRFSRDVDSVERALPWSFENTVRALFSNLGSLVVLIAILPAMVFVILPVLVVFSRLQGSYRAAARESQRLTSISRSPRFAHFKETLSGLTVIRSFHKTEFFTESFFRVLEEHQRMFYSMIVLNRWFSIRVPLISAVISLAVSIGILFSAKSGAVVGGTVGLALTYALRFWESLNWSVRTFSEVEARMTSVERLKTYAELPEEPDVTMPLEVSDETFWPTVGSIEIRNLTVRYAPHLPDVLKDVSMSIPGGSKVGFIGRTGSGKTTLFQSLFRFVDAASGAILIDGRDIAGIPLSRLRRALAIIPQDPTLFKGTLRENLDRFAQHTDDALWQALERVHLGAFVRMLPNGLTADVKENGHNFSQGQRQLFCLARALLIDAKVIVMDEATASVDVETDALIQDTIRRECAGRTLLIIAHRLGTLSDCDVVIELADGRVKKTIQKSNMTVQESVRTLATCANASPTMRPIPNPVA